MEVHRIEETNNSVVIGGSKSRSFSVASTAEFVNVLSDSLYSNKLLAVVREVMCNAWDAHIMSGITDTPINVHITKNEITISDSGPGIHDDLIGPIYCSYGESTKRGDSASTGGFGLGCKAPFAISDTFTVISCHEGQKTVYVLTKSTELTDGLPELRNIVTTPCGDETGITVTIPLSSDYRASTALVYAKMTAFWGEMEAKIGFNGVPNSESQIVMSMENTKLGLKTAPYGFALTSFIPNYNGDSSYRLSNYSRIYVQYGTVIYPVENHVEYQDFYSYVENILTKRANFAISNTHENVFILMRAEPDSLTVAPSRENLTYSKHTIATLKSLLKEAHKNLTRVDPKIQKNIINHLWEEAFNQIIARTDNKISNMSEMYNFIKGMLEYNHKNNRDKESMHNVMVTPEDMHLYYLSARYKDTGNKYRSFLVKSIRKYIAQYKNPRWNKVSKQIIYEFTNKKSSHNGRKNFRKYILRTLIDKYGPDIVHKYYSVIDRYNFEFSYRRNLDYSDSIDDFRLLLATNKASIRAFVQHEMRSESKWMMANNYQIMVIPKNQKKYDIEKVADHLTSMGFRVERIYADESLQPVKPVRTTQAPVVPKRKGYALLRYVVINRGLNNTDLDYKNKFHKAKSILEPEVMVYASKQNYSYIVNDFNNSNALYLLLKYFPDTALVSSSTTFNNWRSKDPQKRMSGIHAMQKLIGEKATDKDFLNMLAYSHVLSANSNQLFLYRIPEIANHLEIETPYTYEDINSAFNLYSMFNGYLRHTKEGKILALASQNEDDSGKNLIPDIFEDPKVIKKLKYFEFINPRIFSFLLDPDKYSLNNLNAKLTRNDRPEVIKKVLETLS